MVYGPNFIDCVQMCIIYNGFGDIYLHNAPSQNAISQN